MKKSYILFLIFIIISLLFVDGISAQKKLQTGIHQMEKNHILDHTSDITILYSIKVK
ncbi:hypothetical protein [Aquimarina aquimarini]|uniref:hypothetical protein n=1 Tax=Aquimarina aquimarini TaxID=1191734 RepID=UPI00131EED1F|nr:hypothetical protein [Aquimarina aquimarini]